jgi:Flp pilus assembly CpaE family ATPase
LVGGAGATTLAYLIARAAARQWDHSVLVADAGGSSGGLAAVAGVESARSLPQLAGALAMGVPLDGVLYATTRDGVRVIARGPEFGTPAPLVHLRTLLGDAREAHTLTVIDCGTLAGEVGQTVMDEATHVAWVLPATRHGVELGQRVLAAAPSGRGAQLLVARRNRRQTMAPVRALRRIAGEHRLPLVLVPDLCGLEDGNLPRAVDAAQVSVQAILGALRR